MFDIIININDFLTSATEIVFVICILIFIPLYIFKKSRRILGVILYYRTILFGITLWLNSLLISLKYAGMIWVIIGLLFAGIGILPVAIISCMVAKEWLLGIFLIVFILIVISLRYLGLDLIAKYSQGRENY